MLLCRIVKITVKDQFLESMHKRQTRSLTTQYFSLVLMNVINIHECIGTSWTNSPCPCHQSLILVHWEQGTSPLVAETWRLEARLGDPLPTFLRRHHCE